MSELTPQLSIPIPLATTTSKRLADIQAVRQALIELDTIVSDIQNAPDQINIAGNAATSSVATKLSTARTINGVAFDGTADIQITDAGALRASNANMAGGAVLLDGSAKIPSDKLPSFVDDIIEAASYAALPVVGESGKIYLALDTDMIYRWSGSTYVDVTTSGVVSLNGRKGLVTLAKTDVGLGNVDNTADLTKPVSLAMQAALTQSENNAITIAGTDATTKANAAQAASTPIAHVGSGGMAHALVTSLQPGFMVNTDKVKLDAITGTNTGDETASTIKTKLGISVLSGSNTGDQTSITGNAGSATKLAASVTINGVAFDGSTNITVSAVDTVTPRVAVSSIGAANGIASLDSSGTVPANQLPSYVDDVLEFANLAALPGTGSSGKIYVALDTNKIYRWSGSVYIEVSATAGTADAATKLATARTINGVAFDGTANITVNAVDATARIAASEKGASNGVATLNASGVIPAAQVPNVSGVAGLATVLPLMQGTAAVGTSNYAAREDHVHPSAVGGPAFNDTISTIAINTTANTNVIYVLTATLDLLLPANPQVGWRVTGRQFKVAGSRMLNNGSLVEGEIDNLDLDLYSSGCTVTFVGGTIGWLITG